MYAYSVLISLGGLLSSSETADQQSLAVIYAFMEPKGSIHLVNTCSCCWFEKRMEKGIQRN